MEYDGRGSRKVVRNTHVVMRCHKPLQKYSLCFPSNPPFPSSRRQLILPPQLSILHVEQEVDGDETSALESVLECDEERATLLKKEKQLLVSSDESSSDLAQVVTTRVDMCTCVA